MPHWFVDHVADAKFVGELVDAVGAPPLSAAITFRGETRRALAAPFPSRVSFDVDVPTNATLRFAIGASKMEQSTLLVPIEFGVLVGVDGDEERVFSELLSRSQPNDWLEQEVDLSRWAERNVRLTFETRRTVEQRQVAEDHVLPVWGNPVLVDANAQPARPNVVLISIDCLRADHLGAYGYERSTSPHLDAFAREAVLFDNVVASSSYTLPAHASMLTGLPPALHGATVRKAISPAAPYAPETLLRAGYRVNAVVSAAFLSQIYGFSRGFHTYRVTGGRAAQVIDRALRLFDEARGQTQFFFLHLYDIHAPYRAPREFIDRFGDGRNSDVSDLLERVSQRAPPADDAEIEQVIALYDAEIAYVDQELGRFFRELKARELYDNSIIVVTSDHGEAFYEHGAWAHGRAAAIDTPGLYDEIVHIPLIIKWPGEPGGVSITDVVSQVDIAATILEAAGIESPSPWSVGLRRRVGGGERQPRGALAEIATFDPDRGAGLQLAFRQRQRKYIASFHADTLDELYRTPPSREELYDLALDPNEQDNLLESPDVDLGSFRAALRSYVEAARELAPSDEGELVLDEELTEQLRALGYIDP